MQYRLSDLVTKFGGELVGEDVVINAISPIDLAKNGEITFVSESKYRKNLNTSGASAVILSPDEVSFTDKPKIVTHNPYFYFSQVSELFNPRQNMPYGIHENAIVSPDAIIGDHPAIGAGAVIGRGCKIGSRCQIHANVVIGNNVALGDDVIIFPNATIYDNVTIGNRLVLHASSVIGSDGFGNSTDDRREYHRIPQIGGVVIGNNVEVGSNTVIDSGTFTPTIIEDGVRIDNLVQIAHNVTIGAHTGIAGCVGIAGGTKIGRYCKIGGSSAITGHIEIADYSVIGGASNIGKSITKPDLYSSAIAASNYKDWARNVVHLRHLDEMYNRIKALEQQLIKITS